MPDDLTEYFQMAAEDRIVARETLLTELSADEARNLIVSVSFEVAGGLIFETKFRLSKHDVRRFVAPLIDRAGAVSYKLLKPAGKRKT